MKRLTTSCAALFLLGLVLGCGGNTLSSQEAAPQALLISQSDLGIKAEPKEALPAPCGPIPIMNAARAHPALSALFDMGRVATEEAVAIAPSTIAAKKALRALQNPKRMHCMADIIEAFGPREGVGVKVGTPVLSSEGDGGSLVRIVEVGQDRGTVNTTAVVSFTSGRCIASLVFLIRGADPMQDLIDSISSSASENLSDAHTACR